MHFEYVDTVDRFVEIGHEWEELESRCGCHLFQSYRFLLSWLQTGARTENVHPALVLYREQGVLKAVFPGCLARRMGIPFLTWMGGVYIVDYGDILFDSSASLPLDDFIDRAFELLKKRLGFHLYFLYNVREDALVYRYLQRHLLPYRKEVAPFIRLSGDFVSYVDSLKVFRENMKSDTMRRIRRLSALGRFQFRVVQRHEPVLTDVVGALVEQKRRRELETGVVGFTSLPGYDDLCFVEARENPNCHISCLTLNGETIAVHLGYLYKGRLYYFMPSFDRRYEAYSPGRVLIYYLLEDCFSHGVEVFDFSIGGEAYKYHWTTDEAQVTSFVGNGPWGRAFRCLPWRCSNLLLAPRRRNITGPRMKSR
jgi:CelD/BcsL family acetyltransferase involved in cellulose biosynthesis